MPVFTGTALALGALATAAETTAATVGTALATSAAAASGGVATAGAANAALGLAATDAASWAAGTTITSAAAGGGLGGLGATVGGLSTAAGIGGTVLQGVGQVGQMSAAKAAAAEQQKQEALRQKQMNLEADRQRREIIRQSQISQALGINNAASSGASLTGSSATTGILGQNQGNQNFALNSVNENEAIGTALFASNAAESRANSTASLFQGVSNIGGAIASNNQQFGRIGTTLFNG